ncbi:MAG: AAA family ATPase [Pseudomonadota bacterium]
MHIDFAGVVSLDELENLIRVEEPRSQKDRLRLLKLGEFGDKRRKSLQSDGTVKLGAIRNNENVRQISGIEIDYDGETVSIETAAILLREAGLKAIIYSSPSHTPDKPRWRAMVPLASPLSGPTAYLQQERYRYCGIVNAILGGIAGAESFTLSQTYYFGQVSGQAQLEIVRTSGVCVDELECPPDPIVPRDQGQLRADAPVERRKGKATDDIQLIRDGKHIRSPTLRLTGRYVAKGVPPDESAELVRAVLREHQSAWSHNPSIWQEMYDKAGKMARDAADKYSPAVATDLSLRAFTDAELLAALTPEKYLLPGIVPTESYTVIAGALSSYKTTFLHNLLVARATGHDLLGIFGTTSLEPSPAILLNYEDSDPRILRRFQLLIQYQRNQVLKTQGSAAADEFMDRVRKNFRRFTLTGQYGAGLVIRRDRAIVPNNEFIDCLVETIREFASRDILIGIDPLRLAIVGSQNDDDGADTVVHTLNRIANEFPDSGVLVASHTTKAQAKDGTTASPMDAAYATSGSALYSQHARSNLFMSRLPEAAIRKMFSPDQYNVGDAERQAVVELSHGRLSHGPETGRRYFRMDSGILVPLEPLPEATTPNGVRVRFIPDLLRALRRFNENGRRPSKDALENDPDIKEMMPRGAFREALRIAEKDELIENVGQPNRHAYQLSDAGRYEADRQDSVELPNSGE